MFWGGWACFFVVFIYFIIYFYIGVGGGEGVASTGFSVVYHQTPESNRPKGPG